jgi:biofilm PGA synthesis lipoprotein PgaB
MITRNFKWVNNESLYDKKYADGQNLRVKKLDIFNPEAIKRILSVYRELALKRIDSILIQDDFILRFNEGFSPWGKKKFEKVTQVPAREGLLMRKNSLFNKSWNRIKVNQITEILGLIISTCKKVNPKIKIGMNIYYETPLFPQRSTKWYAHDLTKIMGTGLDYIYLMSYHRQIKEEMRFSEDKNKAFFKELIRKAKSICSDKLIVKVQIRDWETGQRLTANELQTYLALIPEDIKTICFTPVLPDDIPFLRDLICK